MSSTLAGNLTVLGSVANLIVVHNARRKVTIGFWEYARVGVLTAVATIAVGVMWLSLPLVVCLRVIVSMPCEKPKPTRASPAGFDFGGAGVSACPVRLDLQYFTDP